MSYELVALENTDLAQRIAHELNKELHLVPLHQFADGELNIHLADAARYAHKTVVIMQSTGGAVNENTLGVSFLAHSLKQAGATKVIAVIPYLGYSRQDRIFGDQPGNMQVVAKLFEQSGIDELITVDLHAQGATQFFSIPVINISVHERIAALMQQQFEKDAICLVAPDKGARDYIIEMAHMMGVGSILCDKERFAADKTRIADCVINCKGTVGVMVGIDLPSVLVCSRCCSQSASAQLGFRSDGALDELLLASS